MKKTISAVLGISASVRVNHTETIEDDFGGSGHIRIMENHHGEGCAVGFGHIRIMGNDCPVGSGHIPTGYSGHSRVISGILGMWSP
ncbi:hypothetical protein [Bifidobacterium sp. UTBIF-78]|uniref:hypothetical protein n=1 Tax=Bifidobacterium sp. UTBIF-78 TaxID=1465263 RepID=UPI001125E2A3|nr:hypothetical protein [Bifidobacterium sp. UTBIF-78]